MIQNAESVGLEGYVIQRSDNKKAFKFLEEIDDEGVIDYVKVDDVNEATMFLSPWTAIETLQKLVKYSPKAKFKILQVKRVCFIKKKTEIVGGLPIEFSGLEVI